MCVTVTHIDGLVLARSVFEHGVNYRSAMIYGVPRLVTDPEEKLEGLRCLTEQAAPAQWDYARRPNRRELAATVLLALSLEEASVKIRTGGPDDGDGPDAALGIWAGVLPLVATWGEPETDPCSRPQRTAPPHRVPQRHSSRLISGRTQRRAKPCPAGLAVLLRAPCSLLRAPCSALRQQASYFQASPSNAHGCFV